MNEPDTYERDQMMIEDRWNRRYHNKFMVAPDCADPDHPGCPLCEEEPEE